MSEDENSEPDRYRLEFTEHRILRTTHLIIEPYSIR